MSQCQGPVQGRPRLQVAGNCAWHEYGVWVCGHGIDGVLGSLGGRGPVCGLDVPGPEVCLGLGGDLGRGREQVRCMMDGMETLSMHAVVACLGCQSPSLYGVYCRSPGINSI